LSERCLSLEASLSAAPASHGLRNPVVRGARILVGAGLFSCVTSSEVSFPMKNVLVSLQALTLAASTCFGIPNNMVPKTGTVTLSVLDSFGRPRSDCHVTRFFSDSPYEKAEYKNKFDKYAGEKIPYAAYTLFLKCDDGKPLGPVYVDVSRPQEFVVIAEWRNMGDWVTGPDPRLAISVETDAETHLSERAWVKVVGVYVDSAEVGKVNPQTRVADFYRIVPGRYLVVLLDADKIICTKAVEFLQEFQAHARMKVSVSAAGCKVDGLGSIRSLD